MARALFVILLLVPVAAAAVASALPPVQMPIVASTPASAPPLAPHIVFQVDPTTRSGDLLEATLLGQSYTKFPGMQHVGPFLGGECVESPDSVVECWIGNAPDAHAALRYVRLDANGAFEDRWNGYLEVQGTLTRVG